MKQDWLQWIDRLRSKEAMTEDFHDFEEALREDPAHLDDYLDALLTEAALERSGDLAAEGTVAPAIGRNSPPPGRPVWLHAAAAVALLAVGGVGYFAGRSGGTGETVANQAPDFVATITQADDIAATGGMRIGQPLGKGVVVVPENSKVGIAMRGGAALEVNGPSELYLETAERVRLVKGRISTYAPPYAHGFIVDTEDGRIVDLGTRFVTAAGAGLGTEVHVVEGLVDTYPGEDRGNPQGLAGAQAGIIRNGQLFPTDFLARRLEVPLYPILTDIDGDGIPDAVETFYGSDPHDPESVPRLLRLGDSFAYPAGPISRSPLAGDHEGLSWHGRGEFVEEGLHFLRSGQTLESSEGALRTTGQGDAGAVLHPLPALPESGVFYISFVVRLEPDITSRGEKDLTFAGLTFYDHQRETLFVGKVSHSNGWGARFMDLGGENYFRKRADNSPHLFVIRVDRTLLVTDIYLDPVPGEPEDPSMRNVRYQSVPEFDRLSLRSGSSVSPFPATFDEVRIGLTWESVVPAVK